MGVIDIRDVPESVRDTATPEETAAAYSPTSKTIKPSFEARLSKRKINEAPQFKKPEKKICYTEAEADVTLRRLQELYCKQIEAITGKKCDKKLPADILHCRW